MKSRKGGGILMMISVYSSSVLESFCFFQVFMSVRRSVRVERVVGVMALEEMDSCSFNALVKL